MGRLCIWLTSLPSETQGNEFSCDTLLTAHVSMPFPAFLSAAECWHGCAGAGLERLCMELSSLRFEVQGNEFCTTCLQTSTYTMKNTAKAEKSTMLTWMHSNCNQKSIADQLRGVRHLPLASCCIMQGCCASCNGYGCAVLSRSGILNSTERAEP